MPRANSREFAIYLWSSCLQLSDRQTENLTQTRFRLSCRVETHKTVLSGFPTSGPPLGRREKLFCSHEGLDGRHEPSLHWARIMTTLGRYAQRSVESSLPQLKVVAVSYTHLRAHETRGNLV